MADHSLIRYNVYHSSCTVAGIPCSFGAPDHHMVYVETNKTLSTGWTFRVFPESETSYRYEMKASRTPIVGIGYPFNVGFVGTIAQANVMKMDHELRKIPVGVLPFERRYPMISIGWNWILDAIEALCVMNILDEKKPQTMHCKNHEVLGSLAKIKKEDPQAFHAPSEKGSLDLGGSDLIRRVYHEAVGLPQGGEEKPHKVVEAAEVVKEQGGLKIKIEGNLRGVKEEGGLKIKIERDLGGVKEEGSLGEFDEIKEEEDMEGMGRAEWEESRYGIYNLDDPDHRLKLFDMFD